MPYVLYVWLIHVVYMLEAIKESQENTEILRRHEAHGRVSLLRKRSTDETYTQKQRTSNYFSWSPSYKER